MRNLDPKAARGVPDGEFEEIHLACRHREVERVRALLSAGVNVDVTNPVLPNGDGGNTPLWIAAQGSSSGGLEVARILVDHGANINQRCEHGSSAAHLACSWGHEDLLRFLVQAGADLTIEDDDGMTPETVARNGYNWQLTKVSDQQRAGVIRFFDELESQEGEQVEGGND